MNDENPRGFGVDVRTVGVDGRRQGADFDIFGQAGQPLPAAIADRRQELEHASGFISIR